MKTQYSAPEIEIINIKKPEVLTSSGDVNLPFDPFFLN